MRNDTEKMDIIIHALYMALIIVMKENREKMSNFSVRAIFFTTKPMK